MSHPDPLFDPDNAYDDDDRRKDHFDDFEDDVEDFNYDDHDDFFRDDVDELRGREVEYDDYDDSMDGDHDSAMESAGWGTDEDYGYYGEDY
jgi:hypothetical protein